MRVTSWMIMDRTIFNLSRNVARLMEIESMLSTGRRINTPSDDPIGTHHTLNYRTRLNEIAQYQANIHKGIGRLSVYEEGLNDLNDCFSSANQLAIEMVNDSNDAQAREAAANVVDSLLQQVIGIINSQVDGRYIYSGHKTNTRSLDMGVNGVTYKGDNGNIDMEIEVGMRVKSNLIGNGMAFKQLLTLGEDADLRVGLTGDTLIADLNMGAGVESAPGTFRVVDNNGVNPPIDLNINVPPNSTVGEIINDINGQLAANGNILSLKIADLGGALEWVTSITSDTLLANLNDGAGVDQSAPGTFRIRDGASTFFIDVDISAAVTVGDVVTTIQTALDADPNVPAGSVTVEINSAGTGLVITDANQPPMDLLVEDIGAGTKAADLGIIGNIDPVLAGTDLISPSDFDISDIGAQITGADLGLLGNITQDMTGEDISPQMGLFTTLSSLNNGLGFNLGKIKISQGDQTSVIDLSNIADLDSDGSITISDLLVTVNNEPGLLIEASINEARTGIQIVPTIIDPDTGLEVVSNIVDRSLIIENFSASDDTARVLGIEGSPDKLGSLILLATALHQNDRDLISELIDNMHLSMNQLLGTRAEVGARMKNMETTLHRLEDTDVHVTRMLSEVQDADIITLVTDLAREENLYQAALLASSKTIQLSLVDFLR